MSPSPLQQVKASLITLVGEMKASDTQGMLRSMEQLDAFAATHRGELDPRLVHFLERRSYAKALDFLGGAADVPAGSCGPRP